MRKNSTFTIMTAALRFVLLATLFSIQLTTWAGPLRSGTARESAFEREEMRRPLLAIVSGQVWLNDDSATTIIGNPPPPRIGPFRASFRIYLRQNNALVRTATSDAQGRFELVLPPGDYRIVPDIMRGNQVLAPGDATDVIIVGRHEEAPALDLTLKRNQFLSVAITYKSFMGY